MMGAQLVKKKARIMDLLFEVVGIYEVDNFFDMESDEMLDEKIEVLTALKDGKTIAEIPNFYDILELYPKNGEMWD